MGTTASSLRSSATGGTKVHRPLTVVSPLDENDWATDPPSEVDDRNDSLDDFNRPRLRRRLILQSLLTEPCHPYPVQYVSSSSNSSLAASAQPEEKDRTDKDTDTDQDAVDDDNDNDNDNPATATNILEQVYGSTHSPGLLQFYLQAWNQWEQLGEEGRDPSGWSPLWKPPLPPKSSQSSPEGLKVEEEEEVKPNEEGGTNNNVAAAAAVSAISNRSSSSSTATAAAAAAIPPLVPTNSALPRSAGKQRPSKHVLGQVGYYCTDTVTPIFAELLNELKADAQVIQTVATALLQLFGREVASSSFVNPSAESGAAAASSSSSSPLLQCSSPPVWYALPTHPGHHAASDSFGGYCYLNHVAALANLLLLSSSSSSADGDGAKQARSDTRPYLPLHRVAILDVDYHCGNGTADIFATRDDVLVVSLHCHPDYEYPFHAGFADDIGGGGGGVGDDETGGRGATLHLPLPPGTVWADYKPALAKGLAKIRNFDAHVCIVSLGLDTHLNDPCAIRRAGFALQGNDYTQMGQTIAKHLPGIPLVFVQEGGYKLDVIGEVAASVLLGVCSER